jgi:hypothetical protein
MKSLSHVVVVKHLQEINSQQFFTQREISHMPDNPPLQYPTGMTTCFFSPTPKITNYTNKYGYGYKFRYSDMKVWRSTD